MKRNLSIFLLVLIILLAIISHFTFLSERILHHDEGVNYFFTQGIFENKVFIYNPLNYHGPFYFYLIFLSFILFGVSEFALRFPATLFGLLLVFLPFIFKIREKKEIYLASIFLLLSPSLAYYSRYSIHEIVFVFFTILAVYYLTLLLHKKDLKYLPMFSMAFAFMFTLKETAIIPAFIFFIIILLNFKNLKAINFKDESEVLLKSLFIFMLIYVLFFTGFGLNPQGLTDSFKGFLPWVERGVTEIGHDKPFFFYSKILITYEWPILLFSLAGLFYSFKNKKDSFAFNFSIFFILQFLIYSLISYKTLWLIINLVAPMAIVASIGFTRIKSKSKYLLLSIGILYLLSLVIYTNFINPSGEKNTFAYVHTDNDILNLVEKLNENYKEGDKILILSNEYWPLPFYLHGKDVNYLDEESLNNYNNLTEYNLLIYNKNNFNPQNLNLSQYWQYKLRNGVELVLVKN